MFGTLAQGLHHDTAVAQVQTWTRERFRLPPEAVVMVSELACQLPGCPPLETVIAFWMAPADGALRHHHKVFKPVQQVQPDDLPPWWMRDALAVPPDWVCDCC
jgi:nitrate reductase delta subunit